MFKPKKDRNNEIIDDFEVRRGRSRIRVRSGSVDSEVDRAEQKRLSAAEKRFDVWAQQQFEKWAETERTDAKKILDSGEAKFL